VTTNLADVAGRVLATVWQDGGQRRARQNAWAAMAADSRRARDRAEAQALLTEVAALVDSRRGSSFQEGRQPGA